MPYYTADLNADIRHYLDDQDRKLSELPVCCECENPIQDSYYRVDHKCYCESCMEGFRCSIDLYL